MKTMGVVDIAGTKKKMREAAGSQAEFCRQRGLNPQSVATMMTAKYFDRWYPPKRGSEFYALIERLRADKVWTFVPCAADRRKGERRKAASSLA
jgi:hypothetical protein